MDSQICLTHEEMAPKLGFQERIPRDSEKREYFDLDITGFKA